MDDLFRFLTVRPANPGAHPVRELDADETLVDMLINGGARKAALAEEWLHRHEAGHDWRYADSARELADRAATESEIDIGTTISEIFGRDASALADDERFVAEEKSIDSMLVAAVFVGPANEALDPLAKAAKGMALVTAAAAGEENRDVHLVLPSALTPGAQSPPRPGGSSSDGANGQLPEQEHKEPPVDEQATRLGTLMQMVAAAPVQQTVEAASGATVVRPTKDGPAGHGARDGNGGLISTEFVKHVTVGESLANRLGAELRLNDAPELLETAGSLAEQPRSTVLRALASARVTALAETALHTESAPRAAYLLGSVQIPAERYHWPGISHDPLPVTTGQLRPIGVGDLLLVREHVKGYEAGEVAHIENILKSEKLDRKTRRFERTEQTLDVTVETTKEEERDTQTTDRFSLKREASDTVKTDTQLKGELSVDAKYGPFVEVKADVSASTQTQTESATKTATEFSKEVVARSVSKVSEKIRREEITKTINEFEEWYEHGFDNSPADSKNIAGVYQWVDKMSEAQIYNYGKRLLFDCIVPEPARFYIWAQSASTTASVNVTDPGPFHLHASEINEGNYQNKGVDYGATDLEPPPLEWITVSKPFDMVSDADPHAITKSDTLPLPPGYVARYVEYAWSYTYHDTDNPSFTIIIGRGDDNVDGMTESVPVSVHSHQVFSFALNVVVTCERTDEALQQWREKILSSLYTGWLKRKQDYDQAVAAANAESAAAVSGRNPGTNKEFVLAELRKACIAELTGQQFDAFGAIVPDSHSTPELDLWAADTQGKYIRFFEQAFEWEHIAYYFYPYYWGAKDDWRQAALFDDPDPEFGAFLRAGAARVVFPVRPGFEAAIIYFLSTGLIWNGGDPPDISASEYVPIVEEIEESLQHTGTEIPVGDPWEVRTPTTLVKLRKDDKLPRWHKENSSWVPDN